MDASQKPVFLFHADANPIGGHITHPVEQLLPPHGSSSLAQAGGHASGQVGPHRIDGVVSFENARSEVFGQKRGPTGPWTSTVLSVVEKLNILEIVRADALVTRIHVTHTAGSHHPTVSFAGTHFHNLTIAGKPIDPVLDLNSFARSEAQIKASKVPWESDPNHLGAAVKHNTDLINATSATNSPKWAWVKTRYGWMTNATQRAERGHVVCSLVKEVKGAEPNSTFGHILHVPEVGNLFLGEICVSHGMFRVTLLRAELGCAADGELSASSGGLNGIGMPG